MERIEAFVTPAVLGWARMQARLSVEEAAARLGRSVEELRGWEEGSARPSLAQSRRIAEIYRRPFAVFYLPEPPQDFETLRDFRQLPEAHRRDYSPELALLIRSLSFRQEWLREYLVSEGYDPLEFVGSADVLQSPGDVAQNIRGVLSVTPEEQRHCRNREEALRMWIDRAEMTGIFVSRESQISLDEARGFVLSDDIAPCIFLNATDSKAGMLFTLVHELAHLWLGVSGVSNMAELGQIPNDEAARIEMFCNRVASLTLLDEETFEQEWRRLEIFTGLEDRISQASSRLKVSEEVVARRLYDKAIITRQQYLRFRELFHERWLAWMAEERNRRKNSDGGPSYYVTVASKNGYAFTRTVVGAYTTGSLSGRDASSLLNVKVNNLRRVGEAAGIGGLSRGVTP